MKTSWINDIKKFNDISGEWDKAVFASGDDNPFLLSDFVSTWWRHHRSPGKEMAVFVLRDGARIAGGVPLYLERKFAWQRMSCIGGPHANITHCLKGTFASLCDALGPRHDYNAVVFDRVLPENEMLKDIPELKEVLAGSGLAVGVVDNGFDGMIDLSAGYDRIVEGLPKRLARYVRAGKKVAKEMGGLKLERVSGTADVRKLFGDYKELSLRSFKVRDKVSGFSESSYSDFYGELLEIFDRKELLDAHRLSAGDDTLAISFGYRMGRGFKWILTAFNPDFQEMRPGHLLIDLLIQEAIRKEDHYFDMYYGGEVFYKQQWCNSMKPLKKIVIYRNNSYNRVLLNIENAIRSNAKLMTFARTARDKVKTAQAKEG